MNITLYGNRDCTDVIKLRFLGWRDYPGLSEWVQNGIAVSFLEGGREELEDRRGRRRCNNDNRGENRSDAINQAMTASRSWKRLGNGFSPRVSGGSMAMVTPCFWISESHFGFLAFGTVRE